MANDIRYEIKGLDKLEKKLDKLGKDLSSSHKKLAEAGALYVHSQIPSYPEPRPGSSYRRTNTLGRTFTAKAKRLSSGRWAGAVGTPITYAPWVVSEEKGNNGKGPQAWFHKGRWWTLQKVVKDSARGVKNVYRSAIRRMLKEA